MARTISSRSPITLGALSTSSKSLDRRQSRNALQRAVRDSEKQHGATIRRWLNLGGFDPETAVRRSQQNRIRAMRARNRSSELRKRSNALLRKAKSLRKPIA